MQPSKAAPKHACALQSLSWIAREPDLKRWRAYPFCCLPRGAGVCGRDVLEGKFQFMAIAAELLSAYAATDFVVFDGDEEWVLKVGVASPRLDALLDRHDVTCATIVTAFNPRSRVLTPDVNMTRHRLLVELLEERGLPFLYGEGRDPSGEWIAETECIVFGISLAEGLDLARRFEQNAVVYIERGRAPRLEFPEA